MKLLFLGTPDIAVPFLEECASRHQVLAVVTRPDKPSGRHLELAPPPVKTAAERLGLPVLQPKSPSEIADRLAALGADMAVVVAYGRILKTDALSATRLGFMNVHFSLLPRCRGAAPISWTLIRGETRSGVTLFWLDEGMDTGPVQAAYPFVVPADMDAVGLARELTSLGVRGLRETLAEVEAGRIRRIPQAGEATLAPKLERKDSRVTFDMSAAELHNRVRGLAAGPRAYILLAGPGGRPQEVALCRTELETEGTAPGEPGAVVVVERGKGVIVQCRVGRIRLIDVQPQGKRLLPATDFVNGLRLSPGDSFPLLP